MERLISIVTVRLFPATLGEFRVVLADDKAENADDQGDKTGHVTINEYKLV